MSASSSRPVSDFGLDDVALPFAVEPLDVRGRVVRLGPSVDAILARHGYLVRGVAGYGLPEHLRITIGLEEHNRAVVDLLARFLG